MKKPHPKRKGQSKKKFQILYHAFSVLLFPIFKAVERSLVLVKVEATLKLVNLLNW